MLSKPPCTPKANINRKADVPSDPLQSPSNNSTSRYHHTRSQKSGAEVFSELPPAKRRKKAAKNPPDGKDDTGLEKPVPPPTLGFPYGCCMLKDQCLAQFHELPHKCAVCNKPVHMLCSRTVIVQEMLGNKKWLEEDNMVCKLCDPDAVTSKGETPLQSASEESGSKDSASDSSYEGINDDETFVLTESAIVKKPSPSVDYTSAASKMKCTYSKC
jgi:hypothetical protein